jgi:hypothetical protein
MNDGDKVDDQNRLLVATFIVGTFLALLNSNETQSKTNDSMAYLLYIVCILGLMLSAFFAFLYILAKGHNLRYRSNDSKTFVDRHYKYLYNAAMYIYVPVIVLLGYATISTKLLKATERGEKNSWLYIIIFFICSQLIFHFGDVYRWLRKKSIRILALWLSYRKSRKKVLN